MTESSIRHCKSCGEAIKSENKVFCNRACYAEEQRRCTYSPPRKMHSNTCSHCGNHFRSKDEKGDLCFCNRECYDKFREKIRESRKKDCAACGKSFMFTPASSDRQFCTNHCRKMAAKAKPRHCKGCGGYFTPVKYVPSTGRYITASSNITCSTKCRSDVISRNEDRKKKISAAFSGEKHPNWRGGSGSVRRGYRGHGWLKTAERARKRDGYSCQNCGIAQDQHLKENNSKLEVHHIIPFRQNTTKSGNKLSNLITLCKSCHVKADWEYRKNNKVQMVLL